MLCFHAAQTGKHLLRTQNVSELVKSETFFVSATNVARAGKRGNICVDNNVSATMCPRLPGPINARKSGYYRMQIQLFSNAGLRLLLL